MDGLVAVVIPMYRTALDEYELLSFRNTCKVLRNYPIIIAHPEGLQLNKVAESYPQVQFKAFDPSFFKGIMGYNRLMLSSVFYDAFRSYQYILICQLDAYIFRDELTEWCQKGYDYIGAPWLKRRVYNLPFIKQWMWVVRNWQHALGKRSKQDLYDRIGNGGLSLRKVESHSKAVRDYAGLIERYVNREKKMHLFNEDVFWALEPQGFAYPSVEEALHFAFDKYPDLCFRKTGGKLPFGCHAWYKRKMKTFWDSLGVIE